MSEGDVLEQVAKEIVGAISFPKDFNTLEIHANLKKGLEIPLMGLASMPDVMRLIYQKRVEESAEIKATLLLLTGIGTNNGNGNGGQIGYQGYSIDEAVEKTEKSIINYKNSERDPEARIMERIRTRLLRFKLLKTDDERVTMITRLQRRILTHSIETRYEYSVRLIESMVRHFYQISDAIEGDRAKMALDAVKALVLHEDDMFKKMFPEKKSIRERFHIPGAK